jgi:hypothetical protein
VSRSHTQFQRILRIHVLPWVLGAVVLRAMIPMGFMPAEGTTLGAAMCSTQGLVIEEVGIPVPAATMQCDYCLMPAMAAAPAASAVTRIEPIAGTPRSGYESPTFRHALDRSQSARAPPV